MIVILLLFENYMNFKNHLLSNHLRGVYIFWDTILLAYSGCGLLYILYEQHKSSTRAVLKYSMEM